MVDYHHLFSPCLKNYRRPDQSSFAGFRRLILGIFGAVSSSLIARFACGPPFCPSLLDILYTFFSSNPNHSPVKKCLSLHQPPFSPPAFSFCTSILLCVCVCLLLASALVCLLWTNIQQHRHQKKNRSKDLQGMKKKKRKKMLLQPKAPKKKKKK